jgi:parvulin-like peptidyl-prolyl isomerase
MPNPIDVQKALSGASYPSSKQDLIEHAKSNGADSEIIDALNKLPDGEVSGPDQVQKAVF